MADRMNIKPKKLEEYVNAFQQNLSLDEKLSNSDNKEHSLADIITDENANATAKAEYEGLKEALNEAMTVLRYRAKIVVLRYGLNEESKKTLDEIGKMFGITKECVRQTEIRAIKRLKDFCSSKEIDLYCC